MKPAENTSNAGSPQPDTFRKWMGKRECIHRRRSSVTQVIVGQGTSLACGCVVHRPCKRGMNCFVGFRAVDFDSTLGNNVFVGSSAVVQNVALRDFALVPPGVIITSQKNADALGRVAARDLGS